LASSFYHLNIHPHNFVESSSKKSFITCRVFTP